jgi:hypothetical protein
MGKAKEQFIEAYGGFDIVNGEGPGVPSPRIQAIDALNEKLRSGSVPLDQVEGIMDQLRKLQGIPDPEWDYEPND